MVRRYQPGDHWFIGQIFFDAVHQLTRDDYSEEQRYAWAAPPIGFDHWERRCERKQPFVKEIDGKVVGFIELDPDGHVDCTYVDPAHARRGVMSEIMAAVKTEARRIGVTRLYAEVSLTARPFFERQGFRWVSDRNAEIREICLANFNMECQLEPQTPSGKHE